MNPEYGTIKKREILDEHNSTATEVRKYFDKQLKLPYTIEYEIRRQVPATMSKEEAIETAFKEWDDLLANMNDIQDDGFRFENYNVREKKGRYHVVKYFTLLIYNS